MALGVESVVDMAFPVRGELLPVDHGYALFGAICRALPWLHGDEQVGVHPIRGRLAGGRALQMMRWSRVGLRLPVNRLPEALPLMGQTLEIDGARVQLGAPTVEPLQAATTVSSRLVVIKGFQESAAFLDAAQRQLDLLGVGGQAALIGRAGATAHEGAMGREANEPIRRTLRVRDKTIVGFALAVTNLTAEGSLRVQEAGVGGRRRFGCGLLSPFRG